LEFHSFPCEIGKCGRAIMDGGPAKRKSAHSNQPLR